MVKVTKSASTGGSWLDKSAITTGDSIKITSEAEMQPSDYGDSLVAKVLVKGKSKSPENVRINTPSKNALIDAYGEDTKGWVDKIVSAHIEKSLIGGKRVTILYLVPEGYEVAEDTGGYLVVRPKDGGEEHIEYPEEEGINPEDIPF